MTDDVEPRPHTARRLLLACAVLAAAGLAGFLVRHSERPPDATATVSWSTVCGGHDGDDLHRLLGGGPTVAEVRISLNSTGGDRPESEHLCTLTVGDAFVSIAAERLNSEDGSVHRPTRDSPAVTSTGGTAVATCHGPGSPAFSTLVELYLRGAASHNPGRRALTTHILRSWATDLENTQYCGMAH